MCQIRYDYIKGQNSFGLNTKRFQKPYKCTQQLSHCDRLMCQICYANIKKKPRNFESDMKPWLKKPINLTLRTKLKINWSHECTRHIVSHWYTHVLNMVCQCQSKKKLRSGQESAGRRTHGGTERLGDFYKPFALHSRVVLKADD